MTIKLGKNGDRDTDSHTVQYLPIGRTEKFLRIDMLCKSKKSLSSDITKESIPIDMDEAFTLNLISCVTMKLEFPVQIIAPNLDLCMI